MKKYSLSTGEKYHVTKKKQKNTHLIFGPFLYTPQKRKRQMQLK